MKTIRILLIILSFAIAMRSLYSVLIKYFVSFASLSDDDLIYRFFGKVVFFAILIFFPLFVQKIKMVEVARTLGTTPKLFRILIAVLYGAALLMFAFGEEGVETFLLAQINADMAYLFWSYPPTIQASMYNLSDWFLLCLGSVIIGPFAEEFFFRGLLLSELLRKFGKGRGIFYCCLLFTFLHYYNLHIISTMVFSFALCHIYIRTKSLWLCVIIHSVFNLGALVVENFALENLIRSYEDISNFENWKILTALFLISSFMLICLHDWTSRIK